MLQNKKGSKQLKCCEYRNDAKTHKHIKAKLYKNRKVLQQKSAAITEMKQTF